MIPLKTMCRYIPRIHVVESAGGIYFDWRSKREFPFPEGEFTAVSHYQNKQVRFIIHNRAGYARQFNLLISNIALQVLLSYCHTPRIAETGRIS